MNTWTPLEIVWTAVALLAVTLPALYGVWEAARDVLAEYGYALQHGHWHRASRRPPARARLEAAYWWLASALLFVVLGVGWAAVGVLAGLQPSREILLAGAERTASDLSAIVFLGQEIAAAVVLWWGLWLRRRLYVGRRDRRGR